MKNKKYHTVGTIPKYNRKIVESETCSISLNYILLFFCIMYLHICIVSHTKLKDVHTLNREIYTLPIFF